ncbi:MAG: hypothetical protein V2A76_13745 [Planctomycetota bacterium]
MQTAPAIFPAETASLLIPCGPPERRLYNAPMRDRDEFVAEVARLLPALRAGRPDQEAFAAMNSLLAPLIMARATQLFSGGSLSLAATITQADVPMSNSPLDVGAVASDAWLYWLGGDGRRLVLMARAADNAEHFLNGVLTKVKRSRLDALRRQRRETRFREEIDFEGEGNLHVVRPDAAGGSSQITAVILDFMERTRLGGGPLLSFRYRQSRCPLDRLSNQEITFLRQHRKLDPDTFLARSWSAFPPPVEELSGALGYANRNTVDQHLKRAQDHLQRHSDVVRGLIGESR